MILIAGILIGLFAVPDAWTLPVIGAAVVLEVVETFISLRIARRFGPARVGPERIGETGRVVQACRPLGTVRVRGEVWQARCDAGADPGELVRVTSRDGLVLTVEREDQLAAHASTIGGISRQ